MVRDTDMGLHLIVFEYCDVAVIFSPSAELLVRVEFVVLTYGFLIKPRDLEVRVLLGQ